MLDNPRIVRVNVGLAVNTHDCHFGSLDLRFAQNNSQIVWEILELADNLCFALLKCNPTIARANCSSSDLRFTKNNP